jgi:hypothetical protein
MPRQAVESRNRMPILADEIAPSWPADQLPPSIGRKPGAELLDENTCNQRSALLCRHATRIRKTNHRREGLPARDGDAS